VVERLFADLIDGPLARATPDLDAFRRGWIFVGPAALASALAGCAIARRTSADAYRPTRLMVE